MVEYTTRILYIYIYILFVFFLSFYNNSLRMFALLVKESIVIPFNLSISFCNILLILDNSIGIYSLALINFHNNQ